MPLTVNTDDADGAATQMFSFSFVRSLNLQFGEVDAARSTLSVAVAPAAVGTVAAETLYGLLKPFEGSPLPRQLPPASAFTYVPVNDLVGFGNALASVRANTLAGLSADDHSVAMATNLLNTSLNASSALALNGAPPPVGYLNLV